MKSDSEEDILLIAPGLAERHYWRDLWHYRELFYVLAWRDIAVRYKQTIIGVAWALIRPFLTMLVFTVVFNRYFFVLSRYLRNERKAELIKMAPVMRGGRVFPLAQCRHRSASEVASAVCIAAP